MPQLSMQYSTFQSTLSVRRATDEVFDDFFSLLISIHALRKESDHTTCIGSLRYFPFQSTLSVRRATARVSGEQGARRISIHALRKESDRAAGHFCPLSETQASCLALSISNNTTGATNNMPKTSSCLSVSF